MKNNVFGYIFIIFIIVIMGYSIYKANFQDNEKTNSNNIDSSNISNLKKGNEITLAIPNFDTINPIVSSNKKVQDISRIIYEPLINITEDFKTEYVLAIETAKISPNTYVVKLRPGVKWSDGKKFTSEDVKFTIDKLKENEKSAYSRNVKQIKEVDIIDNYTLRIILENEVNYFEYYLSFPILSNSYYSGEDFWNTSKNSMPTTTGRYEISETTNNTLTLKKNSNWWNKDENEYLEKITINLYSTVSELYNAFKMGGIDLITTENQSFQSYIGTIGYNLSEIEGREFIFLALNTSNGLLSDVNIRKAVRCALNKERIIENSYGNMYKTCNFPLNSNNYLINKGEENFFNLDEKNNILSSIGWEWKNGVWQRYVDYKTNVLELNLVVRKEDKTRVKAAEDIKNQLQEQGILVNIIYADDTTYDSYLNNLNYDMMLCNINQPISPEMTTYFGNNNLASINSDEVNEIMGALNNLTDENELKSKYQRLYEIYNNEVPYIGIARNKILALKNSRLEGEIKANWYNMFYNMKEWYTVD